MTKEKLCKCGNKIYWRSPRCKSCSNRLRKGTYIFSNQAILNLSKATIGRKAWSKGLNHLNDVRIKVKELDSIKHKKYGMRQNDWIRFSINLRKKYDSCKICKNKLNYLKLEIHHIIPYLLSKNNEESNLIVICKPCHAKIHYYNQGSLWRVNND